MFLNSFSGDHPNTESIHLSVISNQLAFSQRVIETMMHGMSFTDLGLGATDDMHTFMNPLSLV